VPKVDDEPLKGVIVGSKEITFEQKQRRASFQALPAPFVAGSATSHAAAASVAPELTKLQARVLAYIEQNPGVSDEQIAEGTGLVLNTVRPRRVELAKMGKIVMDRAPTIARSGRKAHTWRVSTSDDQLF
jgi:hypothetical protein